MTSFVDEFLLKFRNIEFNSRKLTKFKRHIFTRRNQCLTLSCSKEIAFNKYDKTENATRHSEDETRDQSEAVLRNVMDIIVNVCFAADIRYKIKIYCRSILTSS